jgi:hypothetical protein
MAYRSCGDEKESVGVCALELVDNLRSEFVANFARGINSAHETERGIDEFADDAGRFELAHSLEREDAVDVALGVASRIAEVSHAELVAAGVTWDAAIRRVLTMEARLIAIHDSARTHQRDFAFSHRFCERSKWRRIVLDPSIGNEIVVEIARARNVCDRHATHSMIEAKDSPNMTSSFATVIRLRRLCSRNIHFGRESNGACEDSVRAGITHSPNGCLSGREVIDANDIDRWV